MELSEEKSRFLDAIMQVRGEPPGGGIGTLSEKTLHAVCKLYMEPDPCYHEIKTGSFVADIARDGAIVEIQTRSFDRLREKLAYYLSEGYVVNVVYPIPASRWISWLDMDSGSVSKRRKCPKKGKIYDITPELYKIKPLVAHDNLDFTVLLVDVQDYRTLSSNRKNRKRGSVRYERMPISLVDRVTFGKSDSFAALFPDGLADEFTSRDFAKAAKIAPETASQLLSILHSADVLKRVGKMGNAYVYSKVNNDI